MSSEFIKSKIFVLWVLKVSLFKHVCENKGRELSFRDIRTMSIRKSGYGKYNTFQRKRNTQETTEEMEKVGRCLFTQCRPSPFA